jgi:hypothetical protein
MLNAKDAIKRLPAACASAAEPLTVQIVEKTHDTPARGEDEIGDDQTDDKQVES